MEKKKTYYVDKNGVILGVGVKVKIYNEYNLPTIETEVVEYKNKLVFKDAIDCDEEITSVSVCEKEIINTLENVEVVE